MHKKVFDLCVGESQISNFKRRLRSQLYKKSSKTAVLFVPKQYLIHVNSMQTRFWVKIKVKTTTNNAFNFSFVTSWSDQEHGVYTYEHK